MATETIMAESLFNWRPEITDDDDRRKAIDLAFDYRGDVTLTLTDGDEVTGYVFNRAADVAKPYLEIFPKNESASRRVDYSRVAGIAFTGVDTAAGRTWEAWQKTVAEAEANGAIAELYPERLDD